MIYLYRLFIFFEILHVILTKNVNIVCTNQIIYTTPENINIITYYYYFLTVDINFYNNTIKIWIIYVNKPWKGYVSIIIGMNYAQVWGVVEDR